MIVMAPKNFACIELFGNPESKKAVEEIVEQIVMIQHSPNRMLIDI